MGAPSTKNADNAIQNGVKGKGKKLLFLLSRKGGLSVEKASPKVFCGRQPN